MLPFSVASYWKRSRNVDRGFPQSYVSSAGFSIPTSLTATGKTSLLSLRLRYICLKVLE